MTASEALASRTRTPVTCGGDRDLGYFFEDHHRSLRVNGLAQKIMAVHSGPRARDKDISGLDGAGIGSNFVEDAFGVPVILFEDWDTFEQILKTFSHKFRKNPCPQRGLLVRSGQS